MEKHYVILIPVPFINSSEVAKEFMGTEHPTLGEAITKITDALTNEEGEEDEKVLVYKIEAFAEACNNQEFNNLVEYFLTTIIIRS